MNILDYKLEFLNLTERKDTNRIVIHHSASHDVSAREIHRWHLEKGYSGIGYHFVIRRNGSIEKGRPLEMIGAHSGSSGNTDGIGICLTGDFSLFPPSAEQLNSLSELLSFLNEFYSKPLVPIRHKDISATICPGNLFPWPLPDHLTNDQWKSQLVNKALAEDLISELHQPEDKADKWFVLAVALNLLNKLREERLMKIKVPKKVTPEKFMKWMVNNTVCVIRSNQNRIEVVVHADNIETDKCVPLIAEISDGDFVITEFTRDYFSPAAAWQAIDENDDTFAPVPFYEWVKDQYLTAKDIKIQKIPL